MTDAPGLPPSWRIPSGSGALAASEVLQRSRDFSRLHPAGLDAPALAAALDEFGQLRAALRLHAARVEVPLLLDADDEVALGQAASVDELFAETEALLRPFELAWVELPAERADTLAADPRLARHRHYLVSARQLRPHLLPDHDEDLLAARDPAAEEAWQGLFEEVTAGLTLPRSVGAAISDLAAPERSRRQAALDQLRTGISPYAHVLARCLDALLADRLALDEIRGFGSARGQSDLENQLPGAAVDALLAAIDRHRPLAQAWNARRRSLLGLDRLAAADDLAPIPGLPPLDYGQALDAIAEAFSGLAPELGDLVRQLDRAGHIDSRSRPRKRSVATCVSAGPASLPFITLTFTGQPGDALTLAHEIGHALHYTLAARAQTPLAWEPPTPIAETAALFAEVLLLDHLRARPGGPDGPGGSPHQLDLVIRTVFRQAMITHFEASAYAARAQGLPLTADRLTDLWLGARRWLDPVTADPADSLGWAVIPHLVQHRFYNYSYAFAALVASGLLAQWQAEPGQFPARYLAFLATGGSDPVLAQLSALGIDPVHSWDGLLAGLAASAGT